jgi:acetolactate synthase-1/2/3 large subunit
MLKRATVHSVADAYLELLAARGVEYFFGNAGTDFAPLLEAFAKRRSLGQRAPRPLTVPHEIPAVAMAHGYAMVTGRPQVVMVHVTVGTAHALAGIMNASRAQVPMVFTAGRTPITEGGLPGARDLHIHWAQESFDQAAGPREYVKWDYELRLGAQLETVVDRALAIARSDPPGPVYLALPREVLAAPVPAFEYSDPPRVSAARAGGALDAAVEDSATILARAKNPIAITKAAGREPGTVAALVELAERLGMPVFEHWPTYVNFPQQHPLHCGYDPAPYLADADAVVVIESDVPWFPGHVAPRPDAAVIQVGVDPLFTRYPIRGFAADVALGGAARVTLAALAGAVERAGLDHGTIAGRRERWEAEHRRLRETWTARGRAASASRPIDMAWLSRCVGDLVNDDTIVLNEYDLDYTQTCFRAPGTFFGSPQASGLGWGLGAALGAKLAAPERTVICCVGDGAYMFGCPTAAHFVARAYDLPVLFVVFNNRAWNAVRRATLSQAPSGWAARAGEVLLSELEPTPDYGRVCESSGGFAERVEDPAALPDALRRALAVVRDQKRQALVDVICRLA